MQVKPSSSARSWMFPTCQRRQTGCTVLRIDVGTAGDTEAKAPSSTLECERSSAMISALSPTSSAMAVVFPPGT